MPALRKQDPVIWKWAPGYRGLYKVSNTGQVKSVPRRVKYKDGRSRLELGCVLRPGSNKGRLAVSLADKSHKTKTFPIHILVCLAFNGPKPTPKHEVNHKDLDKTNNRADNLEWTTRLENIAHGRTNGAFDKCSAPETREKISKTLKRHFQSSRVRQKLSTSLKKYYEGREVYYGEEE